MTAAATRRFRSLWKWSKPFKKRDKTMEKLRFEALLKSLPSHAVHVYTDGSSYGNPGPAGSGFVIRDAGGNYIMQRSHSLGERTNNFAEVDALVESTTELRRRTSEYNRYIDRHTSTDHKNHNAHAAEELCI